ncbi:hypothetical protein BH11PSE8_BH11PSE8_35970 [soil metagenome]
MRPASRLLARLDAGITAAKTPLAADCLKAERAVYLARQGRFEEVTDILAALHRRYDVRPNVRISCWLGLAEGLQSYFSDMGPSARDKLRRTHALSTSAGLAPLRALSAAWLAHIDYLRMDVAAMTQHAGEALQIADPLHDAARSRANLVVAQALHEAGRFDLAQPWYARARLHANAEGDDATLSALMYNMASLRAANVRQALLGGVADEAEERHLLLSADSARRFEFMVGVTSLPDFAPLIRAQILSTEGHPQIALALYEKHMAAGLAQGLGHLKASMLADQAWTRVQVGQREAALADALAARACLDPSGQPGDIAPAHGRLAQVFEALGDPAAADAEKALAAKAWRGHAEVQQQTVKALGSLTAFGPAQGTADVPPGSAG